MKSVFNKLLLGVLLTVSLYGQQLYQGPASGSVSAGVFVSTDSYSFADFPESPIPRVIKNKEPIVGEPLYIHFGTDYPAPEERYVEDPNVSAGQNVNRSGQLLQSFHGIGATNSYPPDPHIAAGPVEIVGVVNSVFTIWDKQGNELKSINAGAWFNTVLQRSGPFDPKVFYDHFAKRWVMVWLNVGDNTSYYLISVSDDSTAMGLWTNWALPSYTNGMTDAGNWGDYQGVGFDEEAYYLSSNQFGFVSGYEYVKIRVIPKAQLLQNDAGAVSWFDLWDIRYPHQLSRKVFNIRPTYQYSASNAYHLLHAPGSGNFVTLYTITDPTSMPVMTARNIQVLTYQNPPSAGQPGSGSPTLESGGSLLLNEPTYRNGYIYAVHSVLNPQHPAYSGIHFMKIHTDSSAASEDFIYGAAGFWHFYPAVAVDKYGNSALTFTRSGNTEYASAYYTGRLDGDPPGFLGSNVLKSGNTVYQLGNPRNRWGDYLGIAVEPSQEETFWMLSEYALGSRTWDNWVGELRLEPYGSTLLASLDDSLSFQAVALNEVTDTLKIRLTNFGSDDLTIDSVSVLYEQTQFFTDTPLPVTLGTYDTLTVYVYGQPVSAGVFYDTLLVHSPDPSFSGIPMRFEGFELVQPAANVLYALSESDGSVYIIDTSNADAQLIGESGTASLEMIFIENLTNGTLFGLESRNGLPLGQYRISTGNGSAYYYNSVEPENLTAVTTDRYGKQYAVNRLGLLYTGDLRNNELRELGSIPGWIQDIAYDLKTESFYAVPYLFGSGATDMIIRFSPLSFDTTVVFEGGTGKSITSFVFDHNGLIYAILSGQDSVQYLYTIDLTTGTYNEIGQAGVIGITDLTMIPSLVVDGREERPELPEKFSLQQNYPNPFNPSTRIEFQLPGSGNVSLKIYSMLGEVVALPLQKYLVAGSYSVEVNSLEYHMSSGVYFYELSFEPESGKHLQLQKKMILLK